MFQYYISFRCIFEDKISAVQEGQGLLQVQVY